MAALQGAANGAPASTVFCSQNHMLAKRTSELDVALWLVYVNTLSNVADGDSREGLTRQVANACGFFLEGGAVSSFAYRLSTTEFKLFRVFECVREGIDPVIESKDSLQTINSYLESYE